jgi:hypothetical protein
MYQLGSTNCILPSCFMNQWTMFRNSIPHRKGNHFCLFLWRNYFVYSTTLRIFSAGDFAENYDEKSVTEVLPQPSGEYEKYKKRASSIIHLSL